MGGVHLSDPFRVRADVFIAAALTVLNWAVGSKRVKRTEHQLRAMLPFDAVGEIVQHRRMPVPNGRRMRWLNIPDVPDPVLAPLRAYLAETAGFNPERAFDDQGSAEPAAQHGEVLRSLGQDLAKYLK